MINNVNVSVPGGYKGGDKGGDKGGNKRGDKGEYKGEYKKGYKGRYNECGTKRNQVSRPLQFQTVKSIQQDKNLTYLIQSAAIKQQTTPQRGPNDHQRRSIQLVQDLKNKAKRF